MRFELSEALADQILFAMEDQNVEYTLDTEEGIVSNLSEIEDSRLEDTDRYISLPEWESADGFHLMEDFVASLRNPIVRDELTDALDKGRGVFRAFKDVLSRHTEVERLWFLFKEKEMRKRVVEWYNALREEWGLEKIGEEPEDTEDLVLEDFRFRAFRREDEDFVHDIHERCAEEYGAEAYPLIVDPLLDLLSGDREVVVAENSRGELSGFVCVRLEGDLARVEALEVRPEYRGLGIGDRLQTLITATASAKRARTLLVDLPEAAAPFARVLAREGFETYLTRYRLDLEHLRKTSG
jgi:ribosomal protein S18 acetylase RimI-like enzyme